MKGAANKNIFQRTTSGHLTAAPLLCWGTWSPRDSRVDFDHSFPYRAENDAIDEIID
jgi:hypothetical protein